MDSTSPISITIGNRRLVNYAFLKPDRSPGKIDGPLDLMVSDFEIGKVKDNSDGKSYYVSAIGAGPFTVTETVDGDLGAGVKTVQSVLYFMGVDLMVDHISNEVGDEEPDPDFDGSHHTERLEPATPAQREGTAAPSGAGDAGPTPPAPGDTVAGGEGPEPAAQPVAGT